VTFERVAATVWGLFNKTHLIVSDHVAICLQGWIEKSWHPGQANNLAPLQTDIFF
jgi:hypothetical protein